jgi:hypothetical protein
LLAAACSSDPSDSSSDATWVGTITTEGDITTVVNESGSVWGGTATLVEEASIGVEAGADEYMLGEVHGLAAGADRIYVVDQQVPAVRAYDFDGRYLTDLGRRGEGPGEYMGPGEIAVGPDGRVWVKDRRRLVIFAADGTHLETRSIPGLFDLSIPQSIVVTPSGELFVPNIVERVGTFIADFKWGMFPVGEDGELGVPRTPPSLEYRRVTVANAEGQEFAVPFSPDYEWLMAPSGAIVAGASDRYRIEVRFPDDTITIIEKEWEPIPVRPDEADWHARAWTAPRRPDGPSWLQEDFDVPAHKPAFSYFVPDHSGRLWVVRPGAGQRLEGCDDGAAFQQAFQQAPCWRDEEIVEVFGAGGRFHGRVLMPRSGIMDLLVKPYIRDDLLIAPVEDEAGMVMVKRFRLVLPGEGER